MGGLEVASEFTHPADLLDPFIHSSGDFQILFGGESLTDRQDRLRSVRCLPAVVRFYGWQFRHPRSKHGFGFVLRKAFVRVFATASFWMSMAVT